MEKPGERQSGMKKSELRRGMAEGACSDLRERKGIGAKWNRMGRDEMNEMWMWRDGEKSGEKGRFRKTV